MSWIRILLCIAILVVTGTACQSSAPVVLTPTSTATDPPASPTEANPQPYPLAPTVDPYLEPASPDPYSNPEQGIPLVPGEAQVLYPGVEDGAEVFWDQAVSMLLNGEVTQVMQTHDLKVYLTLHDGRTLLAFEPQIDEVMKVIQSCGDPCSKILVATE